MLDLLDRIQLQKRMIDDFDEAIPNHWKRFAEEIPGSLNPKDEVFKISTTLTEDQLKNFPSRMVGYEEMLTAPMSRFLVQEFESIDRKFLAIFVEYRNAKIHLEGSYYDGNKSKVFVEFSLPIQIVPWSIENAVALEFLD